MAKRGNNEGSIYKRKDGRWTGAVTIGGGRASLQRKQFYGQTRQEVARKLTEALKATKDSVPLPLDRLTVGDSLGTGSKASSLQSDPKPMKAMRQQSESMSSLSWVTSGWPSLLQQI